MSRLKVAFALGILVLCVALFVPAMINATEEDQETTVRLSEGDTKTVTDRLTITADSVPSDDANVTLTLTNTDTLNETTATLNESEVRDLSISNETVMITVDNISGGVAKVTARHSPMFGWDSSARTFFDNMGIMLALLGFLIVAGLVAVGVKS